MPGPPKKDPDQTRRRRATAGFRQLPYEGRKGPPPPWPIAGSPPSVDEQEAWQIAWATPQAAEWERLGAACAVMVARYVRIRVEADMPNAMPATRAEVRQMEDRLGLSPMAMMKLRWETDEPIDDEPDEEPAPKKAAGPRRVHVPRAGQ